MAYETLKSILVLLAIIVAGAVFAWKVYQLLWVNLSRGQASGPFGDWLERAKGVVVFVGAQFRLFRFLVPGTAHFFIFWGFLILFPTILQAIIEGLVAFYYPHFTLPIIGSFGPFALLQDIAAVMVICAVVNGLYLRIYANPERYKGSHKSQGVMVLCFIFTIMLSLLIINGIRINLGEDPIGSWRPISAIIGLPFAGLSRSLQHIIAEAAYWIHLGVVLLFLTELPGGKHFHVVTSIPAVFLRNLEPRGRLAAAPETDTEVGVSKVERFRWRQMLDFYTCTECGRCQDVCPAYTAGQPLSPKMLMLELRDHLIERGAALGKSGEKAEKVLAKSLIGDVIAEDVLWSCTTCYACDQECPLFIEHVGPVVDMRRYLVNEGRMDAQLQDALTNLGRYGNSFGQSDRARSRWSQPIQPKIKDIRKEPAEYLWFLGDYASYNTALTEVTRKTVEVFRHIGLDFGILYEGERNAGNDVRRAGEEGLFGMLMDKNLATLNKCNYQTIVTTDPHSYNTLKNEYHLGGMQPWRVLHISELLDQMISSGKLALNKKLGCQVTYHDPCYLGRYNGVYDAPRRVIAATGCTLVEMPRNKDRALCCGAGGGRIWMEEGEIKERPSEARIREAAALANVSALVVACPKDVTMYRDAAKTTGFESKLAVKDLVELVHEAL
jgi:Fe-S oxidoreductase